MHHWLCAFVVPLVAMQVVPSSPVEMARRDKGRTVALVALDDPVQREAFDNKTDDQNDGAGRYYPLKVGNAWNYKVTGATFQMKVTRFEKVADQMCARIEM